MAEKPNVLLVEGRDDEQVIYQFCNHHRIDNRTSFEVKPSGSYEDLRNDLSVRPKTGVKIIGAIVDADLDLPSRWRSLTDALKNAGYKNLPQSPEENGTVIPRPPGLAKVGLWVMPNNISVGNLEDFISYLIPTGDVLWPYAGTSLDTLPESRFKPVYRSKAAIHTWLAWQEEPGTPLGQAITKRYLDAANPLANGFRDWLLNLFDIPTPQTPPQT